MALILPIIVCLVINIITSRVFDENNYFQSHLWPKLAALAVTGLCCGAVGLYANSRPPRIVIDEKTGMEKTEKPDHHLMFIKLEYWGFIFIGIALVLLVFNLTG